MVPELPITPPDECPEIRQHQKTPLLKKWGSVWICACVILLGQNSCNKPRDRSSYSGSSTSYARVSIRVDSQAAPRNYRSSQRHLNISALPEPTVTALIIAVNEGTTFSENYNNISDWHDKQLVDLTTSTVTMMLPLNQSLQLFEYTFNQSYSLSDLNGTDQFVFTKAILGPFTLTESTTEIELDADLEYALNESFDALWNNSSNMIEIDENDGQVNYSYEIINWQTLAITSYLFDPTTGIFTEGQSPKSGYELVDTEWVERSQNSIQSTFDNVDNDNYIIYYKQPDFSAALIGIVDLPMQGLDGGSQNDGDQDRVFMEMSDFSPGAVGYLMEISGQTEPEYRLDQLAETHECSATVFSSLGDFIDYSTTVDFTCQNGGMGPCLRFDSYTAGKTSGDIIEVIRDENYSVVSEVPAGTWEIQTIQTQELLFFFADDPSYYRDGLWATFWSVVNSQVWAGHHQATDTVEESMVIVTFNDIAIADYRTYLESAPLSIFEGDVSGDTSGDGCTGGDTSTDTSTDIPSQNWGEVNWGNFTWGP